MKTIWAFRIQIIDGVQIIVMPKKAEILCADIQGEISICIWALVDIRNDDFYTEEYRRFIAYRTGHPIEIASDCLKYIGTVQQMDGLYVRHIFEITKNES